MFPVPDGQLQITLFDCKHRVIIAVCVVISLFVAPAHPCFTSVLFAHPRTQGLLCYLPPPSSLQQSIPTAWPWTYMDWDLG